MTKIVLGLSGGVDSSVAAARLMQAGYEVLPVFLRYKNADAEPAERTCRELGLQLHTVDMTEELENLVIRPFMEEYLRGRTPNPCVVCNPGVKFELLFRAAREMGAEKVATGHYAVVKDGILYAGGEKDQSYMMHRLQGEMLSRCVFPLTGDDKYDIRQAAAAHGLSAADAPDSMEICFIPGEHGDFMEERGMAGPTGRFIGPDGRDLGPHKGIHRYTPGQRRGLGIAWTGRLYVEKIAGSDILLTDAPPMKTRVRAADFVYTGLFPHVTELEGFARVRHRGALTPCRLTVNGSEAAFDFKKPVFSPAPGQSAVFYTEKGEVVGGGFIE